jgi:hypothetical protein
MTKGKPEPPIGLKVSEGKATIDEIVEFISSYLPDAVDQFNKLFAPRQLIKRDRETEPLPTDKRQLSSYRTRLGTMLEYALSTYVDREIEEEFGKNLRLAFAVAHEYPDYYVRDAVLGPRIRIEVKAVDRDSEEQAARFEVLSGLIKGEKDIVILLGWEWCSSEFNDTTACEFPQIFSFVVVPAAELAYERDKSVELRGGKVEEDVILVPSKKVPGELTEDKGNVGKILRIVHQSRKAEPFELSAHIQKFLQFVAEFEDSTTENPNGESQE